MGSATKTPVKSSPPAGSRLAQMPTLLDSPNLLRACFDAFPQPIMLVENEHVCLANLCCARLFGYRDASEIVGLRLQNLLVLQQRFCLDLLSSSSCTTCQHPSCEKTIRRVDGGEVRVQVQCTHFQQGRQQLLLLALRELGEVELARAVRDDQLRFHAIFDGAAIGIASSTLQGRIIESNAALTRMLGYSTEELAGMHARELHPGDFEKDEQLLHELMEGLRDSYQLEKRFRRKDGSYIWGNLTVSLVRDADGCPAFVIAMVEDTTIRKRVEEQLRDAEKMEVIGRLAGGVAHDFNNLLTGMLLYCDLALVGLAPDSPVRAHVQEIRIAGEQGAALTQQLLQMARKEAAHPRPVQLNEVLASSQNLLRRLIGERIDLVTAPGANLGLVLADPAQLRQVLLNLTLNARDAMPAGGRIMISTKSTTIPETNVSAVSLVVEDTGCGMGTETLAHLFEPFFTTKKAGQGTGLGLATVDRIVKESGGKIEVESNLGRGTKFEVYLPVFAVSS